MPRLRHTVEQILAKLREAKVVLSKWPTGWHQRQSHTRERGLVLMVSEVCARGYGAGRIGEGSARGQERLVDGTESRAAVGVAETAQVVFLSNLSHPPLTPPHGRPSLTSVAKPD
jgi:hypothetical protein